MKVTFLLKRKLKIGDPLLSETPVKTENFEKAEAMSETQMRSKTRKRDLIGKNLSNNNSIF
jgi:hypothetical protein